MKAMRDGLLTVAVLIGGLGHSNVSEAGIPVIDVANLAQAISQVIAWGEQQLQMVTTINNQVAQIQNQATQIQRITGSRNLGQVYNNLSLQQVVPANSVQVLSAVTSQGFNGLTQPAQALRLAAMIYNCVDKPAGTQQVQCQAPLSLNSQRQAWTNSGLTTVTGRVQEIQSIQQQINTTTDPMALGEVAAALQAETAQVTNDQNRIALMHMQIDAQQQAIVQQAFEREMRMQVANAPSFSDNLVFP